MRIHAVEVCPACGRPDLERFQLGEGRFLQRCAECDTVSAPEYGDPSDVYQAGYLFGETECGMGWELGKCWDIRKPKLQEWLWRVAQRRIAMIERVTGVRGSLLDVGCGTGEVLQAARESGWDVQGIEPEPRSATFARDRGLPVSGAYLEEAGLPERSYDVVVAFHVLEHTPQPVEFLKSLKRWTRPGGHVVVEVPNFKSIDRRRMGAEWRGLCPLQHITHFTPDTLRRALEAGSLDVTAIRSPTWAEPPQRPYDVLAGFGFGPTVADVMGRIQGTRVADPPRVAKLVRWKTVRLLEAIYDRLGWGFALVGFGRAGGS
jgi:SAM-dependent methyltransferase